MELQNFRTIMNIRFSKNKPNDKHEEGEKKKSDMHKKKKKKKKRRGLETRLYLQMVIQPYHSLINSLINDRLRDDFQS